MKDAKVSIIFDAKNKAGGVLKSIYSSIDNLKQRVFSVQSALAGLAGGLTLLTLGKSFLDAGRAVENFQTVLVRVTGSQTAANKAFADGADVAKNLAYEYKDIMNVATLFNSVMSQESPEFIKQMLYITGDLATFARLSFSEAGEQIMRMYTSGAASADLFRERGVNAMLGFKSGVSYTAKETMDMLIAEYARAGSKFRGLSSDMAKNHDGLTSMLSDHWMRFRTKVNDAGLFDGVKKALGEVLNMLDELEESGKLDDWAKTTSDTILSAFESVGLAAAGLIDFMRKNDIIEYGIMGKLLFGTKGMIGGGILGAAGIDVADMISRVKDGLDAYSKGYISGFDWIKADDKSGPEMLQKSGYYSDKEKGITEEVKVINDRINKLKDQLKSFYFDPRRPKSVIQDELDSLVNKLKELRQNPKENLPKEKINENLATDLVKDFFTRLKNPESKNTTPKNTTPPKPVNTNLLESADVKTASDEDQKRAILNVAIAQTEDLKTKISLTKELIGLESKALADISISQSPKEWEKANKNIIQLKKNVIDYEEDLADAKTKSAEKTYKADKLKLEQDLKTAKELKNKIELTGELIRLEENHLNTIDKNDEPEKWQQAKDQLDKYKNSLSGLETRLKEITGSFGEGFNKGFENYLQRSQSTFQAGVQMAEDTATAMQQGFSGFFFDVMNGELDSLEDHMKSFLASIQQSLANIMANQLVQYMVSGYTGGTGSSAGGGSTPAKVAHSGGLVMHTGGVVPYINFGSLATGEVPAVLMKRERVLSVDQNIMFEDMYSRLKNMEEPKGNSVNVAVNVENQSSQSVTAESGTASFDGEKYIATVILKDLNQGGKIAQALKGRR